MIADEPAGREPPGPVRSRTGTAGSRRTSRGAANGTPAHSPATGVRETFQKAA